MKGISPMIATVLLIGFTVAVGAILAVWFSTFTKTQTASVSKSSSCSTTTIDVSAPNVNSTYVEVMIENRGPETINVTSITVRCGDSIKYLTNLPTLTNIEPGETRLFEVSTDVNGCDVHPPSIDVFAKCANGGTTKGACESGSC